MDPQVLAATPYLRVGTLLSLDQVLANAEERQAWAEKTGAIACDMESLPIARACQDARIRFLAVRVITDMFDDQLPAEIAGLLRQRTVAGKLGAVTGAVFRRLGSLKEIWHLRDEAQKSSARLGSFLRSLLPQLAAVQNEQQP
jgi:nucleoside phosphorylase